MEHFPRAKRPPRCVSSTPNLPANDLRNKLNARLTDLREQLSRPNASDLRCKLNQIKIERLKRFLQKNPNQLEVKTLPTDLRTQLEIS